METAMMADIGSNMTVVRSSRSRWMAAALLGALLAGSATAATGDNANVVRDLAGRVGPIIGSASACPDLARPRVQFIADKCRQVIRETARSEERHVGKECRSRWSAYHATKRSRSRSSSNDRKK